MCNANMQLISPTLRLESRGRGGRGGGREREEEIKGGQHPGILLRKIKNEEVIFKASAV